ncbi:ankyrin repeat-containing domain protein [Nemania serpens]|nr:ankyrin repeat-containing domain protein [Nemania serpens]
MDIGDDGRDALHYAIAQHCCLDMVKYLVARGYRVHSKLAYDYDYDYDYDHPNSGSFPALYDCIIGLDPRSHSSMLGDAFISQSNDRLAIVDFLLEQGAGTENVREHYTLLESALMSSTRFTRFYHHHMGMALKKYDHDTIEIFKRFLFAGAPLYGDSERILPPRYRSVLTSLIVCDADDTLIFQVIDASSDDDIHFAEPNLLLAAIGSGRVDIVRRLLDRGAQVRHPDYAAEAAPSFLVTRGLAKSVTYYELNYLRDCAAPLAIACRTEDLPIDFIEELIKRGAEINPPMACCRKLAALHVAALTGKLNVASLLLKYGADVNVGFIAVEGRCKYWDDWDDSDDSDDLHGIAREVRTRIYTPLDFAVMEGRLDMVYLLRGLGGKSRVPGKTGVDSAIALARKWNYYAIADFLCTGV